MSFDFIYILLSSIALKRAVFKPSRTKAAAILRASTALFVLFFRRLSPAPLIALSVERLLTNRPVEPADAFGNWRRLLT